MPAFHFRLLIGLVAFLSVGRPAGAQSTLPDACDAGLADATALYEARDFAAVEPLVIECVYHPDASPEAMQRGYRLLALAFVKQDLLAEARLAIVKILGVDVGYEADPIQDPPTYVALVGTVKDQLLVSTPPSPGLAPERVVVNVNSASTEALQALNGIGPVLAGRIVDYRERYGPFRTVDDLQEVRGIGPRTVERLAPHVVFEGPVSSQSAAGGVPDPALVEATSADPQAEEAPPPPRTPAQPVDINAATASELQALSGIGPVLAGRIVDYRERYGPFRTVDDLQEVRGIGPRTLEDLAPYVTVGPERD